MSKFQEDMGGFFHDLLRAAGITMTPVNAMERLRDAGNKVGAAIEHEARVQSIKIVKKLQDAVSSAFKVIDIDIKELESRVTALEQQNTNEDSIKRTH